jgi:choline dehydrogenase-like flavoprotein
MNEDLSAKTVIVGTGPAGATLARELARRGEEIIVVEKGRDHQWPVGRVFAYFTMYDIKKSADGVLVRRGITTGGSTMLYSGNSYDPPPFLKEELGIDLAGEVAETKEELTVNPVPESFFKHYSGTLRLVEAAEKLGYDMQPQERFIDPDKCDPACDRCLFGCKRGAKWTARSYLEDAVAHGARLVTRCDVRQVLVADGAAEGVEAKSPYGLGRIHADRVLLAAGGIGTPMILQNSKIADAGSHFFTDPMSVLVGVMKDGPGTFHEITYTFADESDVGDFVIGNVGAVNAFAAQIIKRHLGYVWRGAQMKSLVGMFVKLCDEPNGRVDSDGTLHKKLTPADEQRMARGVEKAREIMTKAGVIPETISVAKGIGGHPGGTAAIGRVVDRDLQTSIKNLYVCDNSVMPRSGGIPPVLTLIALAKQTARTILA